MRAGGRQAGRNPLGQSLEQAIALGRPVCALPEVAVTGVRYPGGWTFYVEGSAFRSQPPRFLSTVSAISWLICFTLGFALPVSW
jgi:hypothetical protein